MNKEIWFFAYSTNYGKTLGSGSISFNKPVFLESLWKDVTEHATEKYGENGLVITSLNKLGDSY